MINRTIANDVQNRNLSYLGHDKFDSLFDCLEIVKAERITGDFVEFGVALGGSGICMAKNLDRKRRYIGFDVFEMIPPPTAVDGKDANARYKIIQSGTSSGIGGDIYYGYMENLLEQVKDNFASFCCRVDNRKILLVKGLFEDTFPLHQHITVSLAHIDCDWHDSVRFCLDFVWERLAIGGYIVLDDYNDWLGCKTAVDEFVSTREDVVEVVRHHPHAVLRKIKEKNKRIKQSARSSSRQSSVLAEDSDQTSILPAQRTISDIGCLTIIQTADPINYSQMVGITSSTVLEYCRQHKLNYELYIGIKRGIASWHATYNRIILLKEHIDNGRTGWILYLDADAYINDLRFSIKEYLETKSEYAAIFTPSLATENLWDINAGVFFINLSDPRAREIISLWHAEFMKISDEDLGGKETWGGGRNDQDLLQKVLRENPSLLVATYMEDPIVLNSQHGQFIRQLLRAHEGDLEARTQRLREEVAKVCSHSVAVWQSGPSVEDDIIAAAYRSVLGRDPDAAGATHYRGILQRRGTRNGLTFLIDALLDSPEAATRRGHSI